MEKSSKKILGLTAAIMVLAFVSVMLLGLLPSDKVSQETESNNMTETVPTQLEQNIGENETHTKENRVTLSFVGDCIADSDKEDPSPGSFGYAAKNNPLGYFFSQVYDVLSKDDLTVANVECVLTDGEHPKTEKDYDPAFWFKAPASFTDIFTLGSVEMASLVNNHTYDYGDEGYEDTASAFSSAGIYVGENLKPVYIRKNGMDIGILCCQLWSNYYVSYIEDALEEMQDKCDYRIVFFHGGTEGVHEPDNYKIDACRYLAESGLCDLIVGSHPHVLQPLEYVNSVPIMYSLGNFCYSANNYPENQTVIFQVEIAKENGIIHTTTKIIPCYVYTGQRNNYQPALMPEGEDYNRVMDLISTPVEYQKETEAPTEQPTEDSAETYDDYQEDSLPEFEGYPVEY